MATTRSTVRVGPKPPKEVIKAAKEVARGAYKLYSRRTPVNARSSA